MSLSTEDHVRGCIATCFLAFCLETAFAKALREPKKSDDTREKELCESFFAQSLDSILLSLKHVRMMEAAIVEKQYRILSEPDKVATAVFSILGMSS